jgi:hypothetical protein
VGRRPQLGPAVLRHRALAHALSARHLALFGSNTTHERLLLATELIQLAEESGVDRSAVGQLRHPSRDSALPLSTLKQTVELGMSGLSRAELCEANLRCIAV